jgi:DNA-binding transcriptional ArsR family regulator
MAHKQLMETLSGLPSHVRAQSLESVPSHRAITEEWRRRQPEIAVFYLSSVETPAGRSLTEADLAPVEWTIHDPSDGQISDRLERRRRRIVRLLNEAEKQNASPTVEDLAGALGSSSATIRRDLAALRAAGIMVNTRGSR